MKIEGDRGVLDEALVEEVNRVLVFVGSVDSRAKVLHAKMEEADWEDHHKYFWIVESGTLSAEERTAWFASAADDPKDCFVMLDSGRKPKSVVMRGRIAELFIPQTDDLDFVRLRKLFAGQGFPARDVL